MVCMRDMSREQSQRAYCALIYFQIITENSCEIVYAVNILYINFLPEANLPGIYDSICMASLCHNSGTAL